MMGMGIRGGKPLLTGCRILSRSMMAVLALAIWAEGAVIDSMEDATLWSQKSVDGTATLTVSTVTGQSGNAVEGSYDLKTGTYVQFGRKLETVDISSGDAISFLYKGTGSKNNVEVKLQDNGGDWFATTIQNVSDTTDWARAILTFKGAAPNFTFAFTEGSSGDSILTSSAIKAVTIGVTKSAGGSGTLLVDDLSVYQVTADTVEIVLDKFNDTSKTTTNTGGDQRGVYVDVGSSSYAFSYDTVNKPDGETSALKVVFTKGGSTKNTAWLPNVSDTDLTSCTEIVFQIKGDTGATLGIGMKDASGTENLVYLSSYLPVSLRDSWQTARIPLKAFSTVSFASTRNFQVWLAVESKNGVAISLPTAATTTFWIDNLRAFRTPVAASVLKTLDSFEAPVSVSGWSTATGGDATLSVDRATGQTGKAFQLTYAFNSGTYAIIGRKISINVGEGSAFTFLLKGTGGANNVEFKVKDGDGTTYYKVLSGAASTSGSWTAYTIPYTNLVYFSAGTDQVLNIADVAQIDFAITKGSGVSTSGTLAVDALGYGSIPSISANLPSTGVVENLTVLGNPVSPNGDGIEDEVTFQYTLREASTVTVNIYDMRGSVVRQISGGAQAAGSQSMTWDVRDRSGRLCRNGICLFRFDAKSVSGGNASDIRNVIAVIR